MIWLLFGAPGSGKGTQSKLMQSAFGFEHLSTGDMFRKHLKTETDLGQKAKAFIDKGELVPDSLTIDMVNEELKASQTTILDGFPRNLDQAGALSELSEKAGNKISGAIFLDVPAQSITDRLTGRRSCKDCGAVYHVKFSPCKEEGVCDACGGEVIQRKDDTLEVIENRLKVYDQQTKPLMSYYDKLGLLKTVDGTGAADEVFGRIKEVIV